MANRPRPHKRAPVRAGSATPAAANAKSKAGPRAEPAPTPGHLARDLSVRLVDAVLTRRRAFDDALAELHAAAPFRDLAPRDRAFARLIAATVLRRLGELEAVIARFLEKPLPADRGTLSSILLCASAQLLALGTPAHAVVDIAVEQCRRNRGARRFDRLANAVLRRVAEKGPAILQTLDGPRLDIPDWLWQRWVATYGDDETRRIAATSLREAPLDLSVKSDPDAWATRLGGRLLPTGSVRLRTDGRIDDLPGYAEGAWWVQDAAAALPARLLGYVAGQYIADLCAAPGGKTAELAAAGAKVTAVDSAPERLARLSDNLARLGLAAEIVAADVTQWCPDHTFDAVLLDAPCIATGAIRRHPDILRLKRASDVAKLAAEQARMLASAAHLVKPGGRLVYCTCSLEPEEGIDQIEQFLRASPEFERLAIAPGEAGVDPAWLTPAGDLRTLPCHLPLDPPELSGMDGFYAARLKRQGAQEPPHDRR